MVLLHVQNHLATVRIVTLYAIHLLSWKAWRRIIRYTFYQDRTRTTTILYCTVRVLRIHALAVPYIVFISYCQFFDFRKVKILLICDWDGVL